MSLITRPGLGSRPLRSARAEEGARLITIAAATIGLVVLGMRLQLSTVYVPIAVLIALALIPVTISTIVTVRWARLVVVASMVGTAGALLLLVLNPYHHRFSAANAVAQTSLVLGIPIVVLFILWARRFMPSGAIIAIVGMGMLVAVDPTSALFPTNPWKFGYSLPVAMIVLGLAEWSRNKMLQIAAFVVLIGITLTADARSGLAIFALAAALLLLQLRRRPQRPRRSAGLLILVVAVLAVVTYFVGQQLILDGALGAATQARSAAQIATGGSLILGGRPELGASGALLLSIPLGFGAGAIPSSADVHTAQAGMLAIGYDPFNNYVYGYMFGSGVQLHSVAADLWAICGIPGIVLGLVVLVVLVAGTAFGTATQTTGAGVLYVAVWSLWSLGFSPFGSSFVLLVLALALVLPMPGALRAPPIGTGSTTAGLPLPTEAAS